MNEIEGLGYDVEDAVAHVTLRQPESLNALTPTMLEGLPVLLHRAVEDKARAILLTGEGRAFCSGARLGGDGVGERDLGAVIDRLYNPLVRALADSPIPIVTALNGLAAGAGVGIALGADIVVAARSSYLLLAFANIGLVPDAGSTWLIAQAIGRARTLEMALLAERLPAERAQQYGLVARVVDDAAVHTEALAVARKLAAMPTLALGLIRRQVRTALGDGLDATLDAERAHQQRAGYSADHTEGVRAFREKRPPNFTGG